MPPALLTPPFSEVPVEERAQYLQRAFTLFDTDSIGALELNQLLSCMKAAGIDITRRQALAILRELKLGSDAVVDLPLFLKFIQIASRSTEVASQFKANQEISATKKKIINIYVVVLFFLTFALTLLYISSSSKSRIMLIGIVFLSVLLVISVFYVIVFPLIALRLRRRRAQVLRIDQNNPSDPVSPNTPPVRPSSSSRPADRGSPPVDPRFVVFRVANAEVTQDLERGKGEDEYSLSNFPDEPEIFTRPGKLGETQSYRKPQLPSPVVAKELGLDEFADVPALQVQTGDERRPSSASADDALALVPAPAGPVGSSSQRVAPNTTRTSSFNPLRTTRR